MVQLINLTLEDLSKIIEDSVVKALAYTNTEDFNEIKDISLILRTKISDFDLTSRTINSLKWAEIETLGELVSYNKSDLMKFRNFGKKSLEEVVDLVDTMGLCFGMDVERYLLINN